MVPKYGRTTAKDDLVRDRTVRTAHSVGVCISFVVSLRPTVLRPASVSEPYTQMILAVTRYNQSVLSAPLLSRIDGTSLDGSLRKTSAGRLKSPLSLGDASGDNAGAVHAQRSCSQAPSGIYAERVT